MTRRPEPQAAGARSVLEEQWGRPLADAIQEFEGGIGVLSWGDRLDILDAWSRVLDGAYAHLPLKRALYGFDPIRALEHLRQQVPALSHLQFHRELTTLINRLRDAHTQYQGPRALEEAVAHLPFLVEAWGPEEAPRYVVSKVTRRELVKDAHFRPGVEVEWWNGVPFDRAVDLHAERETGGRPDARRARALDSLTLRALGYAPPPDEHWVDVGYRDLSGKAREVRLEWRVSRPGRVAAAGRARATRGVQGINPAGEALRRAKKLLFNEKYWRADLAAAARPRATATSRYGDFLSARRVKTRSGLYGYLRVWSFDVDDDQGFLGAAIRLLEGLPDRGLILDLRHNPGGLIWAAERMLQLFTPSPVVPTRFALRATPLTAAMASAPFNQPDLGPWAESLATAAATGEPYSGHLPITTEEQCNDVGQRYGGPVVVVVDANTYSSGDLFTAGVVDNRIGPVLCVGAATGAGGANVWTSDDLRGAMAAAGQPLPELPGGARFTVAIRRAVRSGEAEGALIEDAGITGQPYAMTRRDVLGDNQDLIERCGQLLAAEPWTRLRIRAEGRKLTARIAGLDRIDLFGDGHPIGPSLRPRGRSTIPLAVPAGARQLEVVGYAGGSVRQRRRLVLDPRPRRRR
jgi:hypothetical protein